MKPDYFSLEIDSRIATLTMTRGAEMNTITPAMWRELEQVLDELQRDVAARREGRAPRYRDLHKLRSFSAIEKEPS